MKLHKRLIGALVIAMVLFLAACSGGDNNNNNNDDEKEASGDKITIFQSKVEISEELEELAEEYTEETGVEVDVWGTTGDDYFNQLQIRLNSDQGPSIFSALPKEAEKLESYLYDMSDESYVDDIAPDMELEQDGKIVGVPYGVEGFGLIYNKDLVDESDIADYDSFVDTLEKFSNDGDVAGLSLAEDAYFLIGHISNYPFSLQDDNVEFIEKLNDGDATMAETKEFQEFGSMMEDIRANIPNPMDVSYDEQIGDFATGKTAMIHQGNWAYDMFDDYDIDFDIGMAPLPFMDNDKLEVGVGTNWIINGNKSDAETEAANDFLEWMFTSDTGKEYIVDKFGFVPAMTSIEANDLDPLSEEVMEASNSGETIPWSHDFYPTNVVVNDFTPAAQDFFLDEDITGEELIESLDEAWQSAIE